MSDLLTEPLSRRRTPWVPIIAIWLIGLAIAAALDWPIYQDVVPHTRAFFKFDFGQFLRCGGYLPTWLVVAAAIFLYDVHPLHRATNIWRRALTLLIALCAAGGLAEVVKVIARRERAETYNTWYTFRPFADRTFSSSGFGMPSSHAIIAFTAAFVLSRMFKGTGPALFALAVGTSLYRIGGGAHMLSDVYVSFGLAWLTTRFVERWLAPRPAIESPQQRDLSAR